MFITIYYTIQNLLHSGQWKPDAEKEECGQDLNLSFIYCNDEDHECLAKRNEFPYMVCQFFLTI